jgi:UDP-N-acetylglucosamine--N-acetylmuramyl-(pentapeptide) pyrophosphoryl-undecaprenol N-acetylglucosamine transferase
MKIKSKPKETNTKSILIAAAGTGGHIMPAMAVADKLINKKFNLFWAGTPNGMENRIVDKKKIFFISLAIGGFRGKKVISLISYPFKFALCLMKVMWVI